MAIFKITPDKSLFSAADFRAPLFESDSLTADSLIVEDGAFLIATGEEVDAAILANTGAWNVTVGGTIYSTHANGIVLSGGNKASSTISIGDDGFVRGYVGINVSSPATINNAGDITGSLWSLQFAGEGTHTLKNTGTISGTIVGGLGSELITNTGTIAGSIGLGDGNDKITNSGAVTDNVTFGDGVNALSNSGTMNGGVTSGNGDDAFTNTGTITGFVNLGGGNNKITNADSLTGNVLFGSGNDVFSNSGTMIGDINLGSGGSNTLINTGNLQAEYVRSDSINNTIKNSKGSEIVHLEVYGTGKNVITNSGEIQNLYFKNAAETIVTNSGHIDVLHFLASGSNASIYNSGTIYIDVVFVADTIVNSGTMYAGGARQLSNSGMIGSARGTGESDTFTNSGVLATVDLQGGNNKLTNSGTADSVLAGAGDDTVTNSKSITGDVVLGDGNNKITNGGTIGGLIAVGAGDDVMTNTGKIVGNINLGGGNDKFTGGASVDQVFDDLGTDSYSLGAGNDIFNAVAANVGDEDDFIDAGAGVDQYFAGEATTPINVDLVTKLATGLQIGVSKADTILNFEDIWAGSAADILRGSAVANFIRGSSGNDLIEGRAGNDVLDGGGDNDELLGGDGNDNLAGWAGSDKINGGKGRDVLAGGSEVDTFVYTAAAESGILKTTRDTISDFQSIDFIDLSAIDANTGTVNNDGFNFIGANVVFTGVAGQLRAYWTGPGQVIEGDINGDKRADFTVELLDSAHAITLNAGDFIL